jgi:hypothetical protein
LSSKEERERAKEGKVTRLQMPKDEKSLDLVTQVIRELNRAVTFADEVHVAALFPYILSSKGFQASHMSLFGLL